jgi:hypothetical protein
MTEDEIKQLAFNQLGFEGDVDFTSSTDIAVQKMDDQYENTIENAFQRYRWGFARDFYNLTEYSTLSSSERYSYLYGIYYFPSNFLFLRNVYANPKSHVPLAEYDILPEGLYSNNDNGVYIEYTKRVDEANWPAYFIEFIKNRLALDLCYDLTGDPDLIALLTEREARSYIMATNIDSRERKPKRIRSSPFVDVRG